MKTLIIHPKDPTTHFLDIIYKDRGWTVLTEFPSKRELRKQIKQHDRIMMMGHGTPIGLLGHGGYVIEESYVDLLKNKPCVCIWCNADQFVLKHKIKGFYTGMFISEVGEANFFGIRASQDQIDHSNYLFVNNMREIIDSPNILNEIKSSYVGDCPVIQYNNKRLYSNVL